MFVGRWVDLDMRRYSALLLLIGILKASGSSPYISPGIQLGVTSKTNFFLSAQITFGQVSYSGPPPFGATIGLRYYRMQKKNGKNLFTLIFKFGHFLVE